MKYIISLLVILAVPLTASADCRITDTSEKFEVVCSGYNPMTPQADAGKNAHGSPRFRKERKSSYERRENESGPIAMTDAELQYMQTKNRQDGLRVQRRSKGQPGRKAQVESGGAATKNL